GKKREVDVLPGRITELGGLSEIVARAGEVARNSLALKEPYPEFESACRIAGGDARFQLGDRSFRLTRGEKPVRALDMRHGGRLGVFGVGRQPKSGDHKKK